MGGSAEPGPCTRPSGGRVSVDELARRKGVQPIRSFDDLACDGIFETDEELDEFLTYLAEKHRPGTASSRGDQGSRRPRGTAEVPVPVKQTAPAATTLSR